MDTGELTDIPQQNIQISGLPDLPDDFHIDGIEVVIKGRGAPPKNLA